MSLQPPTPLADEDYELIEAAVMETARGRWFLREYAQRNRSADTREVLKAVERLERLVRRSARDDVPEMIRGELRDIDAALRLNRAELASLLEEAERNGRAPKVDDVLDVAVASAAAATQDVVTAAERVQEIAWILREQGIDSASCDELDQRATDIYLACTFQHSAGQRTAHLVATMRQIEGKIAAMVEQLGIEAEAVAEPAAPHPAKMRDVPPAQARLPAPAAEPPPPPAPELPKPAADVLSPAQSFGADEAMFVEDLSNEISRNDFTRQALVEIDELDFLEPEAEPAPVVRAPPPPPTQRRVSQRGAAAAAIAYNAEPEFAEAEPAVNPLRDPPASPHPEPAPAPMPLARRAVMPEPTLDFAELAFAEKAALFS